MIDELERVGGQADRHAAAADRWCRPGDDHAGQHVADDHEADAGGGPGRTALPPRASQPTTTADDQQDRRRQQGRRQVGQPLGDRAPGDGHRITALGSSASTSCLDGRRRSGRRCG